MKSASTQLTTRVAAPKIDQLTHHTTLHHTGLLAIVVAPGVEHLLVDRGLGEARGLLGRGREEAPEQLH